MNKVIHMMIGLPACGKSTKAAWIYRLQDGVRRVLICPDTLRLKYAGDEGDQSQNRNIFENVIPTLFEIANVDGTEEIIYDATNYNRKNRRWVLTWAKKNGWTVVGYVFDTSVEECKKRNANRERTVPDFVYERMNKGWEEPMIEEGFSEITKA